MKDRNILMLTPEGIRDYFYGRSIVCSLGGMGVLLFSDFSKYDPWDILGGCYMFAAGYYMIKGEIKYRQRKRLISELEKMIE